MRHLLFANALALSLLLPVAASATDYKPQVAAHRGASAYIPEHTLPAKSMAYAMGVDFVEQDVVMTKDGRLVVMHDIHLDTTTDVAKKFPNRARQDGRYYVSDFTYDEVRSLRVTERFNPKTGKAVFASRFPDAPIDYQVPSLEEEFYQVQGLNKATGRDVSVYVEVKQPDFFTAQGLDILKAVIDTMTKFGYNSADSKAILQIFDYEAVIRSRELGWKGELCMLVTAGGQSTKNDKPRHAWLQTEEGIKDIAKYATIYAPNFNLLAKANADGKGYTLTNIGDLARKHGMKLHSWTLRKDSLPKGFQSWEETLDVAFKQLKIEGMFSDFPDLVVDYLKANGMR